jgi:hypothetical protein
MAVTVNKQEMVMKALLNKISEVLTAGDKAGSLSKGYFISWCSPGIPFQQAELDFAVKGLKGSDGDETDRLIRNAIDFSRLVNLVPKLASVYDQDQQKTTLEHKYSETTFDTRGVTLEDVYKNVLYKSEVYDHELTPQQEEKVKKLRAKLTVEEINPLDEDKKTIKPSPIVAKYLDKQGNYLSAVTKYNEQRLSAWNNESTRAVQDFALNGDSYYQAVKSAESDWIVNGYKNEFEEMVNYLDQVTQKSIAGTKKDLQVKFEKAKMSHPELGDFRLTSFHPASFVTSDKGWTEVSFSESSVHSYNQSTTNSWEIEAGLLYKLFIGNASSNGSIKNEELNLDTSNISFKFKLAQLVLSRPWFSQSFLENTSWRFIKNSGQSQLSFGGHDPKKEDNDCQLPAITTAVIFAKDIEVYFDELSSQKKLLEEKISTGASVGFGPFSIGGKYTRGSGKNDIISNFSDQGIKVEGMQIIGFKCALLPKSPNTSPELTNATTWV